MAILTSYLYPKQNKMFKVIIGAIGVIPEGKYLSRVKDKETKEQCLYLLI